MKADAQARGPMRPWLVVPILCLSALAACSDGGDSDASAEVTVTATATVTETVTAAPKEIEEPDESAVSGVVGDELSTPFGSVQVLEVVPKSNTDPSTMEALGDERWAAARIRTCVASEYRVEPIKLGWGPWVMTDNRDSVWPFVDASGAVTFREPMYPQLADRTTRPGTCAEGWITFSMGASSKIAEVVYESQIVPEPLVWSVG